MVLGRKIEQNGLNLEPLYTGVMGPDVWFEIADAATDSFAMFVRTLEEVGVGSNQPDETGTYLDVPLVFEKRQRRHRR